MTILDIKEKYGISNLIFYRVLNERREDTKWLKASDETLSNIFLIHEFYFRKLKENIDRKDLNVQSLRKYDASKKIIFHRHIITLTGSFFTITLFDKELTVNVNPKLRRLYFDKVLDFEAEHKKLDEDLMGFSSPDVRDKIAIEFEVDFTIENYTCTLPYVIVLEKIFDPSKSTQKFVYRKLRARLCRVEEIPVLDEKVFSYFLHCLFLLDRTTIDYIKPDEFENHVGFDSFFFHDDLKYNSNKNCLYIVANSFYKSLNDNVTKIELSKAEQVIFKGSKYSIGNLVHGYYYLNIFPVGFIDSYAENFIGDKKNILNLRLYSSFDKSIEGSRERFNTSQAKSQGETIFQGTYENCFFFLQDKANISKIQETISISNDKIFNQKMQNETFDYYNNGGAEEDYFYAMTDGQPGSYDDFIEDGGDIDNL